MMNAATAAIVIFLFVFLGFKLKGLINLLQNCAGFMARTLSSEVFISELDPERVLAESIFAIPALNKLKKFVSWKIDRTQGEVKVSIFGVLTRKTVYGPNWGSWLVRGAKPVRENKPDLTFQNIDPFPNLNSPADLLITHPKIEQAISRAFANSPNQVNRQTRAVLVVHKGKIIGERYAPGINQHTALLSYSLTKSFTNALLGILVSQKKLKVTDYAPVKEWQKNSDPRKKITIEHLVRMSSGLAIQETNSGQDEVSRMLFNERDMAQFAKSSALEASPGTRYAYSSGNTIILCSIIRDLLGGCAEDVLRFAHKELFSILGMRSSVLEFDAAGTPIGSTYLFASARDWARLGLLYLHQGRVGDRQIFQSDWVKWSTLQTLESEYAAGFRPTCIPATAKKFQMQQAPNDTFFAAGHLGQYLVMVPSHQLAIVRLGATHAPLGQEDGVGQLLKEIIDNLCEIDSL